MIPVTQVAKNKRGIIYLPACPSEVAYGSASCSLHSGTKGQSAVPSWVWLVLMAERRERWQSQWLLLSVQFSHSVVSDSLRAHRLQTARLSCPSPAPRACPNSFHRVCDAIQPSPLSSPSPPVFPSIRVFSNESVLPIRWQKYWSFRFIIRPSNEYSGLISFRMDWLDLLAVQGTLKSLLQYLSSKASIVWCSAFFIVQLLHPYLTTGKTIALFYFILFYLWLTLEIHLLIKTTNTFTFICIYFLRHLFPGHKFLFLQFLLGYLFLLCNFLFWFRNNLFFFSKDHLNVAGRAHVGVDPTVSSVSPAPHLGALFTWMCSMTRESTSKPLSSVLLSTNMSSMKVEDFSV